MLVMASDKNRHMDAEDSERYSMGDLPEELSTQFEEHLLICEACRNRVAKSDEFVRSIERAGKQIRLGGAPRRRPAWRQWTILLAAASLLLAMVVFGLSRGGGRPEFAVSLAAMRGAETMAQAPAGTPLALHPGLTGLPSSPSYRLEMVDAAGATVWRGTFPGARVPPRRAGAYFVRVYSAAGELLREYGLQVR
jgi:anti-sigma factor RsiW